MQFLIWVFKFYNKNFSWGFFLYLGAFLETQAERVEFESTAAFFSGKFTRSSKSDCGAYGWYYSQKQWGRLKIRVDVVPYNCTQKIRWNHCYQHTMGRVCGSLNNVFWIVYMQALNTTGYSLPNHASNMVRILCRLGFQVYLKYIIKCYYNTNNRESFHPAGKICAVLQQLETISKQFHLMRYDCPLGMFTGPLSCNIIISYLFSWTQENQVGREDWKWCFDICDL